MHYKTYENITQRVAKPECLLDGRPSVRRCHALRWTRHSIGWCLASFMIGLRLLSKL